MEMFWHNASLQLAGLVGAAVAVMHGVAVQRLIVVPFARNVSADRPFSPVVQRLVPLLIHFSTFVWFAGGIALALATQLDPAARLSISLMVGATYLFGALGNFWATRGAHPGWVLMVVALALIAFGVIAPSSQV
jgi:hypothetical protein